VLSNSAIICLDLHLPPYNIELSSRPVSESNLLFIRNELTVPPKAQADYSNDLLYAIFPPTEFRGINLRLEKKDLTRYNGYVIITIMITKAKVFSIRDRDADELVIKLWAVFPHLFRLIRWRHGMRGGLSIYHYEILGILFGRGALSMSEIGRFVGISRPNLTPIMDSLVRDSLVERLSSEEDRRIVKALLTAKGQARMQAGQRQAREEMKAAFSGFSNENLKELVFSFKSMARLLSQLDTRED
jgi:DNA-binding MarR family transcriptional regulator